MYIIKKNRIVVKFFFFLSKDNYENINYDFIDIIYIEELDYDFLVEKIKERPLKNTTILKDLVTFKK